MTFAQPPAEMEHVTPRRCLKIFINNQNLKKAFISSEECSNRGGTSDGTCANGFGICCVCKST